MHDIVYILYLKQQKALQFVCCQKDNRAKFVDKQWLFNPNLCIQKTHAETLLTSLDFGASVQKLEEKKKSEQQKETLTLAASKNELCVCVKQQTKKKKKKAEKRKKKKRKNFLFLVRTTEGYLTDFFHL